MRRNRFSGLGIVLVVLVLSGLQGLPAMAAAEDAGRAPRHDDAAEAGSSDAASAGGAAANASANASPPRTAPVYTPPRRGRPRVRVGAGVRGTGAKLPTLRALVPDHVAQTARSQPALFWELGELPPEGTEFVFSLTTEEEIDPLIRAKLETPAKPGIQRIDLASYDFSLQKGLEYEWSVALVADRDHRSRDLVTLGWIERVDRVALGWIERVEGPQETLSSSSAADAATLAAAGLWYDAVDVANPSERAALLGQVGLDSAGNP